jgi:2,3-bisphosphoglycerate-dependent phosphoglycerate mutase
VELILVRHGLPERRQDTDDPPLAPEGREQAQRVAGWLAAERIDAVVTSPMLRAVQTADPYLALNGLQAQVHTDIVEFDRGSGAYVPLEVLKREDYAAWQALVAGEGVDIAAFHKLVVAALEQVIRDNAGRNVAVFCHGGVINVWTAHVLGLAPRLFFEPGYASIHRYLCARSGQRNVVALNERGHLRPEWPARARA